MGPYDPFQFNLLLFNYLALLVLLPVVLRRRNWQIFDGIGVGPRVAIVIAVAVGWVQQMRFLPNFLHENGHGHMLFELILDPSSNLHVYGSGYIALFYPLFKFLPPRTELLVLLVGLLSLISVASMGFFVARLFSPGAGALSALALALLNTRGLHSSSESRFVVLMSFGLLALWLAMEARRTGRLDVALLCALAAAPAAQIRAELIFFPIFVVGAALLPFSSSAGGRTVPTPVSASSSQLETPAGARLRGQIWGIFRRRRGSAEGDREDPAALAAEGGSELSSGSSCKRFDSLMIAAVICLFLALLLAGHLRWMWGLHWGESSSKIVELLGWGALEGGSIWQGFLNSPILLEPSRIPYLFLALVGIGVWVAWPSRKTELLFCLLIVAVLMLLYANASHGLRERERFILPAHLMLMSLVGPGAWALAVWAERRSGLSHIAPAVGAMLVMAGGNPSPQEDRLLSSWEHYEQRQALAVLPQGCQIFTLGPSERQALPPMSPAELEFRLRASEVVLVNGRISREDEQILAANLEDSEKCALYLRTSACSAFEPPDRKRHDSKLIRQCAEFESQMELETLSVVVAQREQFGPQIFDYPELIEVGFFRITGIVEDPRQREASPPVGGVESR